MNHCSWTLKFEFPFLVYKSGRGTIESSPKFELPGRPKETEGRVSEVPRFRVDRTLDRRSYEFFTIQDTSLTSFRKTCVRVKTLPDASIPSEVYFLMVGDHDLAVSSADTGAVETQ